MGVCLMILFYVLENIGMIIGFFLIIGILLFFVSYGGSLFFGVFMVFGFVLLVRYNVLEVNLGKENCF